MHPPPPYQICPDTKKEQQSHSQGHLEGESTGGGGGKRVGGVGLGGGGVKGRRASCERAHSSFTAPALHFAPVLTDSSLARSLGVNVRLVSAAAATFFFFFFRR